MEYEPWTMCGIWANDAVYSFQGPAAALTDEQKDDQKVEEDAEAPK